MSEWRDARNILAIRLDNIGDVVLLSPALRAVKDTVPDARITLLASPAGASAAPLLPQIDDVMIWRGVWQDVGGHMPLDPAREQVLVDAIRARAFDAALVFTSFSQTPHVPGYVCYLAGVPLRAGESKEFGGSVLTTELRGAPDELHQAERNLRLVEALGYTAIDRRLALHISPAAHERARRLVGDDPFVLVHPGASAAARRWPAARYAAVARALTSQGWRVVVSGVERERALVDEAAAGIARTIVGETTLDEFAAIVARARAVICGNSLPLHLADAVGTPVVALYSGTDLESQWAPRFTRARLLRRDTPCHPCYGFECPIGLACLDVETDRVVAETLAIVAEPIREAVA
jgi:ADP-heptose:LPS heptosyltransferase